MTVYINTEEPNVAIGGDDGDDFFFLANGLGGGDDKFSGGKGGDNAFGGIGNDVLKGGSDNDSLFGGDGDDLLYGGSGDDYLDSGTGKDVVVGGGGNDTIVVSSGESMVDGGSGIDSIQFTDLCGRIVFNQFGLEGFLVFTDSFEEFIFGSFDDSFEGADEEDVIFGSDGNDTLIGGGGNDILDGSTDGFSVNDKDTLNGGSGNDKLYGGGDSDRLVGGGGNDLLDTGGVDQTGGDDTALGGAGNDTLTAANGHDVLNGGSGIDTAILVPTFTNVVCDLLSSDPVEIAFDATVTLISIENVTIAGNSTRTDLLFGSNIANRLDAGKGDDRITGRGGSDTLIGNDGNDALIGSGGADQMIGGLGADTMTGGAGGDRFRFTGVADSPEAALDRITDFESGSDLISLKNFIDVSGSVIAGPRNVSFVFIGSGAFSGDADELRFSNSVLQGDSNRDGIADFAVRLAGVTALAVTDFLF